MNENHTLPSATGRDIVAEIEERKEAAKKRARRERCLGTGACDCRRCV
jgi:hypothetical protein